jgi:hypothetical protein
MARLGLCAQAGPQHRLCVTEEREVSELPRLDVPATQLAGSLGQEELAAMVVPDDGSTTPAKTRKLLLLQIRALRVTRVRKAKDREGMRLYDIIRMGLEGKPLRIRLPPKLVRLIGKAAWILIAKYANSSDPDRRIVLAEELRPGAKRRVSVAPLTTNETISLPIKSCCLTYDGLTKLVLRGDELNTPAGSSVAPSGRFSGVIKWSVDGGVLLVRRASKNVTEGRGAPVEPGEVVEPTVTAPLYNRPPATEPAVTERTRSASVEGVSATYNPQRALAQQTRHQKGKQLLEQLYQRRFRRTPPRKRLGALQNQSGIVHDSQDRLESMQYLLGLFTDSTRAFDFKLRAVGGRDSLVDDEEYGETPHLDDLPASDHYESLIPVTKGKHQYLIWEKTQIDRATYVFGCPSDPAERSTFVERLWTEILPSTPRTTLWEESSLWRFVGRAVHSNFETWSKRLLEVFNRR